MPADLNHGLSAGMNLDLAVPTLVRPAQLLRQQRYLLLSLCVIISSALATMTLWVFVLKKRRTSNSWCMAGFERGNSLNQGTHRFGLCLCKVR